MLCGVSTAQDPCFIVNATDYEPYELGKARDIYVKWPNASVMPLEDFLVTNSTAMLGYVSKRDCFARVCFKHC